MNGLSLLVHDDGTYSLAPFDGDGDALREVVGGWIEPIPTDSRVTMWCNEDGKGMGLPVNRLAMDVWIYYDDYGCLADGDFLVGNVVITGGVDSHGDTLDLSEADRAWVLEVAAEAID